MTQVDLGLLRFVMAGNYDSAKTYEQNMVVNYGGNAYVYIAPVATSNNLPTNTAYWQCILQGFSFQGIFSAMAAYKIGSVVQYGNSLFLANNDIAGSMTAPPLDTVNWSPLNLGLNYRGDWAISTQYLKNDLVRRGKTIFICTANHISSSSVIGFSSQDSANWQLYNGGINYRTWSNAKMMYENDLVMNSGSAYICVVEHASGSTFASDLALGKWQLLVQGSTTNFATLQVNAPQALAINTTNLVNTTAQRTAFNCVLPALQPDNSRIDITDAGNFSMNPLILTTSDGSKIGGDKIASIDVAGASVSLIYNSTQANWRII